MVQSLAAVQDNKNELRNLTSQLFKLAVPKVRWQAAQRNDFLSHSLARLNVPVNSTAEELQAKRICDRRWGFIATGGGSIVDAWSKPSSWPEILRYLPRALLIGLLAPFPSQWTQAGGALGSMRLLAAGDMVPLYGLVVFMVIGGWQVARRRKADGLFVLAFAVLAMSAISVVVANLGTLFRLRLQFVFPLLVVAGGGLSAVWPLRPAARADGAPRRLTITYVITRMNIGGPAAHVASLVTRLDPSRFSTCLVTGKPPAEEGDLTDLVTDAGGRVERVAWLRRALHPWGDARAFLKLLRILWRERPHVIHTHTAKAGTLGRVAGLVYNTIGPGRRPGGRAILVHTFHGHVLEGYFHPWVSHLFAWIERALACRTDCLIAVSPSVRAELLQWGVGRTDQLRVVPLGLDLAALAALEPADGAEPLRCGMVGRLVPIKNPSLFLKGLDRLVKRVSPASVCGVFVGDGPLRRDLEAEARRLGLGGVVQFTGWQRDLLRCYRALDAVCLTSWNEGMPMALIEAMAAGRPVVATDVGGVRDLLGWDGGAPGCIPLGSCHIAERGILIRSGDAEGLSAALEALRADAGLRRRLAEAGRAYALAQFGADRLLGDIAALYDELRHTEEQCAH